MTRFLLVLAIGCLAQSLAAQEYKDFGRDRLNSSPRHGEWVDIKSGARAVKAFVVYPEQVTNISCPVYGFYGENDERVNAAIPKAEDLMRAAGKRYEPVIYKGAGHGFMRSGEANNPAMREADKKARDEAWARWKTLLKQL